MIINTVPQVQKNLIDVCITCKASVDNTEWVSSTCHSNVSDEKLLQNEFSCETRMPKLYTFTRNIKIPMYPIHANNIMRTP